MLGSSPPPLREPLHDVAPPAIALRIARLWQRNEVIGPGGACTRAAWSILRGAPWEQAGAPVGQAGNGTAMRTGFLGLLPDRPSLPRDVAAISRITHQDSRSIAGGVAVAAAVAALARDGPVDRSRVCLEVAEPGPGKRAPSCSARSSRRSSCPRSSRACGPRYEIWMRGAPA